jgi:hypothetical protein
MEKYTISLTFDGQPLASELAAAVHYAAEQLDRGHNYPTDCKGELKFGFGDYRQPLTWSIEQVD